MSEPTEQENSHFTAEQMAEFKQFIAAAKYWCDQDDPDSAKEEIDNAMEALGL